jgi:hypothetical protein
MPASCANTSYANILCQICQQHAPTIAELIAGIEARMSAHMDDRIASFVTGYKLVMASLATANAMDLDVPRTSVRDGCRMTDHTSIFLPVHDTNILPPYVTHTLPPHTNILHVHDTNILPPCVTHTLPTHTFFLDVRDTNILPPCVTHTSPSHTNVLHVHDTNILPPCVTHTLPPHTKVLPPHDTHTHTTSAHNKYCTSTGCNYFTFSYHKQYTPT